jgi:hypothetical protein
VPTAYVSFWLASLLHTNLTTEVRSESGLELSETGKLLAQEFMASNPVAAKSFLVGIPAAALALLTKVIAIILY